MPVSMDRVFRAFSSLKRVRPLFAGTVELPPNEFHALHKIQNLSRNGEVYVSDLQSGSPMTLSAVSQTVSSLEKKGLVRRAISEDDRRKIEVRLTERGEELLGKLHQRADRRLQRLMDRFGEDNAEALLELLERLGAVIDEMRKEDRASEEE